MSDFRGLNRAFTFDPWTLGWREQPSMRKGRWYPTQAMLADGRIAILAGWDEGGAAADNPDLEVFTPAAVRGGRGAMTRYLNGERPGTSYYPHLFTMPDGRLLLGGSEPGESALLDPSKLSTAAGPSAWSDLPDLSADYRFSASAVLLPAGPAGSSQVAILGGLVRTGPDTVDARADADVIDTRDANPAWRRDDSVVPPLNRARDYFNVVLLPDGSLASVGGAAGVRNTGSPPPVNSYTGGAQELKRIELLRPGADRWQLGPPQRKWRTYHSSALLLPDGRVLSAGDDYWDLNDTPDPYIRQGPTAGKPLDEAELYEPPYLFDGNARAPPPGRHRRPDGRRLGRRRRRARHRGRWSPGQSRRAGRTRRGDARRRHEPAPRRALGARPGRRQGPQRPDAGLTQPRPAGLVHAVRARLGGHAVRRPLGSAARGRSGRPEPRARRVSACASGRDADAEPTVAPAVDKRAPRASVRARRLGRRPRSARLLVRATEPARVTVTVRIGRRTARSRLRFTATRRERTVTLRLRATERRRLARTGKLALRVTLVAQDAAGNVSRRTVRLRLRLPRAATG